MQCILETDRLVLREMNLDDLEFIAAMLGDEGVMRYWPSTKSRDESRAWIEKQMARYDADGCGYWLAIEKATNKPVGQAGVLLLEIDGEIEPSIGYIMHRPFWYRGFATEAASACLTRAFEQCNPERVLAPIRPANAASTAVARKLGMTEAWRTMYAGYEHAIYVKAAESGHGPEY